MDMRIALIGLLGGCVASAGAAGITGSVWRSGAREAELWRRCAGRCGGCIRRMVSISGTCGRVGRDGKARTDGQYGWGESNAGRSWDAGSKTWTYRFAWGTIRTQYVQRGDALDVIVTEANNANSGVGLRWGDDLSGDPALSAEARGVSLLMSPSWWITCQALA